MTHTHTYSTSNAPSAVVGPMFSSHGFSISVSHQQLNESLITGYDCTYSLSNGFLREHVAARRARNTTYIYHARRARKIELETGTSDTKHQFATLNLSQAFRMRATYTCAMFETQEKINPRLGYQVRPASFVPGELGAKGRL